MVVVALVVVELPVTLRSPTMVDDDVPSPMMRSLVVALSPVAGCVQASYEVRPVAEVRNPASLVRSLVFMVDVANEYTSPLAPIPAKPVERFDR